MAVDLKVTQQLDNNYVKVVANRKSRTREYIVPKQTADEFCANYKKYDKNTLIKTNLLFAGAVVGGCGLGNLVAFKAPSMLRMTIGIVSGMAAGVGVSNLFAKKSEEDYQNLLKSHGATEIKPDKSQTI
ncbi:MAG: hypothetical protein E7Z89_07725 [Cyanobacteria bacterium SIG28]|nr:hypothetical protein [Cyanobacteria bacterium SIG28]